MFCDLFCYLLCTAWLIYQKADVWHYFIIFQKACAVILEALEVFWDGLESPLMDDYKDKQKRRFFNYSSTQATKTYAANGKGITKFDVVAQPVLYHSQVVPQSF